MESYGDTRPRHTAVPSPRAREREYIYVARRERGSQRAHATYGDYDRHSDRRRFDSGYEGAPAYASAWPSRVTRNQPIRRTSYPQFPISDSEEDGEVDEENDISSVSFDVRSGAQILDPQLKLSKQKANLEAKFGESESVTDSQGLPEPSLRSNEGRTNYLVTSSYYTREDWSENSGDVTSRMEYIANSPPRRRDQSMFRWIHLPHENMDFEVFSKAAQEVPGLPEGQVHGVKNFLQRVRKDLERTFRTQRGVMGNFMIADLITKRSLGQDSEGGPDRNYVFCCIPYHQLAEYSPLGATANSRQHPVRTLLQSKYASTTKEREFEQAVRFLSDTPPNCVFHIPHLWCLIVNNRFMITSASGRSAHEIIGDRMRLVPNTPTHPPTPSRFPKSIQVRIDSRRYVLPLAQCDTWFKFTQNFYAYTVTLDDEYVIRWKGVKITAELWPLIIHQTRKEIICVVFSNKKRSAAHTHTRATFGDREARPPRPAAPYIDRDPVIPEADSMRSRPYGQRDGRDVPSPIGNDKDDSEPSSKFSPSSSKQVDDLNPRDTDDSNPTQNIVNLQDFHVLIWNAVRIGRMKSTEIQKSKGSGTDPALKIEEVNAKSDGESVTAYLNSLHSWLKNRKQKALGILYSKGSKKTLEDVEKALQEIQKSPRNSRDTDNNKSELVESVKTIFALFLPLEHRSAMSSKLWGALHTAVTTKMGPEYSYHINRAIQMLAQVAELAKSMKAQLSDGKAPPPEDLVIPPAALQAWQQLLFCLLFWSPRDIEWLQYHAERALRLLRKAFKDLMENPKAKKLETLEAVLPNGLLATIISHVITDFTGKQPGLVDTYWEYFDQLEMKMEKDPLNRQNQAKTTAFISEARIVLDSLEQQHAVLEKLYDEFLGVDRGYSSLGLIHPLNPAQLLVQESLDTVMGKINSVEELLENAQYLLQHSEEIIRNNRDKQEAAIYTFTIVTIIFLPISTVATVLGMNTSDIRDMDKTQWLFWATSLPVTAVVIVGSLYAAGILTWPLGRRRNSALPAVEVIAEPALNNKGSAKPEYEYVVPLPDNRMRQRRRRTTTRGGGRVRSRRGSDSDSSSIS